VLGMYKKRALFSSRVMLESDVSEKQLLGSALYSVFIKKFRFYLFVSLLKKYINPKCILGLLSVNI